MKIHLNKFGTMLTARNLGKEAWAAFQPVLATTSPHELLELDFEGVTTLAPSWADEFITRLQKEYGARVCVGTSTNPSVNLTLAFLKSIKQ